MKKLFLICLLILATQLVFAGPTIWIKTDNSNNKTVNAQLQFEFSADNTNKDTIEACSYTQFLEILSAEGKGTIEAYTPFVIGPEYWDYSTGMKGKGTIEAYTSWIVDSGYWDYSTGMARNDTENLSGIRIRASAKDKNAEIERELKQILLHTPGNTENNDSTFLKVKVLVKEKLQNMMVINHKL